MSEERSQKKFDLVRNQAKFLSSNFDSVQIFASVHDGETGVTTYFSDGIGNWCARYGQVRAWVMKEEGSIREEGAEKYRSGDE